MVIRKVHVINLAPNDLVFLSDSNLNVYEIFMNRLVPGLQILMEWTKIQAVY